MFRAPWLPMVLLGCPLFYPLLPPVEDALHHRPGPAGDAAVLVSQFVGRRAQAAGQLPELVRLGGERVAGGATDQEEMVPGPLAEPVRLGEDGGVAVVEGAGRPERVERFHRARRPDAVLQLQQLGRPLDIAQRPAPELQMELRVLAGRNALPLDARFHPPDLALV